MEMKTLQEQLDALADQARELIEQNMESKGDIESDCQRLYLLNRLSDFEHAVTGIEQADMKQEAPCDEHSDTPMERIEHIKDFAVSHGGSNAEFGVQGAIQEMVQNWEAAANEDSELRFIVGDIEDCCERLNEVKAAIMQGTTGQLGE